MRPLPLRTKVAFWSALVATLSMGAALAGIRYFLSNELLNDIDDRLEREANQILWALDRPPNGPIEKHTEITEDMLPPYAPNRIIEFHDPANKLPYKSPKLKDRSLAAQPVKLHEIEHDGQHYRVITRNHKFFTLRLGTPLTSFYNTLRKVNWAILLALPAVCLFSLGGGVWVAARAMRPVKKITETAERITAEDLNRRLPVPGAEDEIFQLTAVLNGMFARLEKSYTQAVRFASDASHQLKTPIAVMRAGFDTLMKQPGMTAENLAELSDLLQQTRRLSSLAEGLLLLARADAGHLGIKIQPTNLRPVLEACAEDAEVLASSQKIRIETDIPEELPALCDTARVEQVLLNLLENAVKYNCAGGFIKIYAGADERGVFVIVANSGKPVPGPKMSGIFDRFTRGETDETRSGHGLGLAIARELALAQNGELRLLRSDAEVTEFELRLPAAPNPARELVTVA
jgi:signal transduction histidine kinase